jgi:hypothetical protein
MDRGRIFSDARAIVLDADVSDKVGGLYVGGAGVVSITTTTDKVILFTCPAGTTLYLNFRRVNTTSTTATLMVALLG